MLNKAGERELAYLVKVDNIVEMDADRLECARVGGWNCVVGKGEFSVGESAVYFEIDSKLPEVEPFASMEFLRSKHFKVKTQKIRGVASQGLLVPVSAFGWVIQADGSVWNPGNGDHGRMDLDDESRFLTKALGVTYAVTEDNKRKSSNFDIYKPMAARHSKLAKTKIWKFMYKRKLGKKILFFFFGKKKTKNKQWPIHICSKTDVERIQNQPYLLRDKQFYVATEKIDGSSCTVACERRRFNRYKYYVCSRNVVFKDSKDKCYYEDNIYFEVYQKYDLKNKITQILNDYKLKNIALQMEIYGGRIQQRNYSTNEHNIMVFHIVTNGKKFSMDEVAKICEKYDIPHVPIIDNAYIFPDTIEELQEFVEGSPSVIDELPREGIVFYDKKTGQTYTKFVSPNYLLTYH